MGKLFKIIVAALLFVSLNSWAQEYKFGKVSKEELLEKSYPSDSSADAAVLYENKTVKFVYGNNGFELVTEVFKRIKIYNKKGYDYATDVVRLHKYKGKKEKITGLKGVTYRFNKGQIIEIKLKKDGIFKNELSDNFDETKFTLPSIEDGVVIEYKYKIISPFFYNIDRVYLQKEIPIKKIDVKISAPEYFNFNRFSTGYLPINLKESSYDDKLVHKTSTRIEGGLGGGRIKGTSHEFKFKGTRYIIESENVEAFKEEPFSGNIQNYISSLMFELAFTSFPDSPVENYSSNWGAVTKTIYKNYKFGEELRKNSYYKEDIDQLVDGIQNPLEKTALIYNFVRNKLNWNGKAAVFTDKGVKKAYKENTGNSSEINLMLTSMLIYAGINANPVICSTSDRVISLFPTIDGFDYVLTRVKLVDGSFFYLDATDNYGMPNILPERILKGMGRVILSNGSSQMVNLRPNIPSLKEYRVQFEVDDKGVVKGKSLVNHKDYLAYEFRRTIGSEDDNARTMRLEREYGISEVHDYTVIGIKKYGKGVKEKFNFEAEDQIQVIEDEIFFSPLLFLRKKENTFKSDNRKYPVDFGYGFINKYMINIKIPEGYRIIEYPKTSAFKLPDDIGVFTFKSNVLNGQIQIMVEETIAKPVIPANYYPAIKEFYNQVIQKENEQIVLKKI